LDKESKLQHASGFLTLVDDALTRVKHTDVQTVTGWLNDEKISVVLLDVREASEWLAGHILGATHIGKGVIERDIESRIPNHQQKIVLYCGGGYRSALAADSLQRMGYTDVISMDGGYRAWCEAGLPTSLA
jgi:rhodanese-related sulfurtransferase